jgi:adenylylsulfate kinase-like enzyme
LVNRDPKGLYEKALRGEIGNFTGITDAFENGYPDLTINTGLQDKKTCLGILVDQVRCRFSIPLKEIRE